MTADLVGRDARMAGKSRLTWESFMLAVGRGEHAHLLNHHGAICANPPSGETCPNARDLRAALDGTAATGRNADPAEVARIAKEVVERRAGLMERLAYHEARDAATDGEG